MHCAIARDSPAEIRSTRRDQLVNCSLHLNNSGARRAANRTDETNYETFHSLCELWNHNLITVPASHAHFRLPKHWQRVLLVSLQIPGRKREGIRRSVGLNSWNRQACNLRSGKDSSRERNSTNPANKPITWQWLPRISSKLHHNHSNSDFGKQSHPPAS